MSDEILMGRAIRANFMEPPYHLVVSKVPHDDHLRRVYGRLMNDITHKVATMTPLCCDCGNIEYSEMAATHDCYVDQTVYSIDANCKASVCVRSTQPLSPWLMECVKGSDEYPLVALEGAKEGSLHKRSELFGSW